MKAIFIFLLAFFLLFFFTPPNVSAQTCSGSAQCQEVQQDCQFADGSVCSEGQPGCLCNYECGPGYQTVSCTGSSAATCNSFYACDELCGPLVYVSCTYTPAATCGCGGGLSNCCNRSCTGPSGETCQCYGICSSPTGTCSTGSIVPGTCSAPPGTPTPTPNCQYGRCSGSGTSGSGDTSGYYSCDGTCWQWVSCPAGQSWNGSACVAGPTATPNPTGTPPPTSTPSGPTPTVACVAPSFWCTGVSGNICCPSGTTCNINTTSCDPGGGGGGGGGGGPFTVYIIYDANGNGTYDYSTADQSYPTTGIITLSSSGPYGVDSTVNYNNASSVEIPESTWGSQPNRRITITHGSSYSILKSGILGGSEYTGNGVDVNYPYTPSVYFLLGTPTYTISGRVFNDLNGNGTRNAGEPYIANAAVSRDGLGSFLSDTTDANGYYALTNVPSGSYNISLNVPSTYVCTSPTCTNPRVGVNASSNPTVNFALRTVLPPTCSDDLDAVPASVQPGDDSNLDITGCTNVENPNDNIAPPPFDWDPPQDDNPGDEGSPQCSDTTDNDGDGLIDTNDPGCHWDGDATNPASYAPDDDNEANVAGPSQCSDGVDNDGDGLVDLSDPECTSPTDDNESDRVSPGKSGSTTCSDAGLSMNTSLPTSSTATWTAPYCPTSDLTCTVNVTAAGNGLTMLDSTNIAVGRSGEINVAVRDVTSGVACDDSAPLFTDENVTLQLAGPVNTTETVADGSYSFVCLPNGGYTVTLGVPPGYQVSSGSTFQSVTVTNNVQSVRFCLSNFEPWFQTEQGDVRMRGIVNPIPGGLLGSTDVSSPGVFHSSGFTAEFGAGGEPSAKNWVVNNEYSFNNLTSNRNGTVAYTFYKSRARQEGIDVTEIPGNNLNVEINDDGIFEYNGDLTISDYDHVDSRRVVLLVNGDVTIDTEIEAAPGGLFILAASGNITIADTVGHADPNLALTTPNLQGYYSAEGSIILEGSECSGGTPDARLNVAGALIANARKPFSASGGGTVQNFRSLCTDDDLYPSLYVSNRPDFLTQLTDFYKVSYTKWREVRP